MSWVIGLAKLRFVDPGAQVSLHLHITISFVSENFCALMYRNTFQL